MIHEKLIKQYMEDCLRYEKPWLHYWYETPTGFEQCEQPPTWDVNTRYDRNYNPLVKRLKSYYVDGITVKDSNNTPNNTSREFYHTVEEALARIRISKGDRFRSISGDEFLVIDKLDKLDNDKVKLGLINLTLSEEWYWLNANSCYSTVDHDTLRDLLIKGGFVKIS